MAVFESYDAEGNLLSREVTVDAADPLAALTEVVDQLLLDSLGA